MKHAPRRTRAGMTIIELMVSMAVLMIAAGATFGSIASFAGLGESNEQTIIAWNGLHDRIESIYAEEFHEIFALYDDDPANDPDGPGTAPGPHFSVVGLDPTRNDADGLVGEIVFPVSGATPGQLFENHVDAEFSMPRDLNGDGAIDGADHALDYAVLPVEVRVSWKSRTGNRRIELQVLLLRR